MKYYKITNKSDIDLIQSVRKEYLLFRKRHSDALKSLGLGKAVFDREYSSGKLFHISFEGFSVKDGEEVDHTKFKCVRKGVYSVRKSNKSYTKIWNDTMPKESSFDCNLMYLSIYSNVKAKDAIDRVYGTNLSKIVYETKCGCMLIAVADLIKSEYIVKECHERILESEFLRLQGL